MLTIKGCPIEWVNHHLVLGIYIDRHLKFDSHITYLCSQIQKRLNVLRALTAPSTEANSSIIRLIYIMAVRSLIDYSWVCLIMARGNFIEKLDKLQNQALRTILEATGNRAPVC